MAVQVAVAGAVNRAVNRAVERLGGGGGPIRRAHIRIPPPRAGCCGRRRVAHASVEVDAAADVALPSQAVARPHALLGAQRGEPQLRGVEPAEARAQQALLDRRQPVRVAVRRFVRAAIAAIAALRRREEAVQLEAVVAALLRAATAAQHLPVLHVLVHVARHRRGQPEERRHHAKERAAEAQAHDVVVPLLVHDAAHAVRRQPRRLPVRLEDQRVLRQLQRAPWRALPHPREIMHMMRLEDVQRALARLDLVTGVAHDLQRRLLARARPLDRAEQIPEEGRRRARLAVLHDGAEVGAAEGLRDGGERASDVGSHCMEADADVGDHG